MYSLLLETFVIVFGLLKPLLLTQNAAIHPIVDGIQRPWSTKNLM